MTHDELRDHNFTKLVFDAVRPVIVAEHEYQQRHGRDEEYIPEEHGFYLTRAGNRLATLLTHCEQLAHAVLFLTNYRETSSTQRAGITRAKHIRYGMESYIVRTQTLYDLVLKLVDAVFHLTNADAQCRHSTIVQNLRLKRTQVPKLLSRLQKKLTSFRTSRNKIIHRGGYQEEDLYRLELYTELEESYRRAGEAIPPDLAFLPEAKREKIREVVRKRKAEFTRFNSSVFQLVSDVLDGLYGHFVEEERRLRPIGSKVPDKANPVDAKSRAAD